MSCAQCKFGELRADGGVQCRRYPPQMMLLPAPRTVADPDGVGVQVQGMFPAMAPDAWCGEYAMREPANG